MVEPKIDLIWKDLTVKTDKISVLGDCTGKIYNSEISIIIGGIGTGKSTLFNILAGRLNKDLSVTGEVVMDEICESSGSTISLVDETFYFPHLQSVWETLFFAVKFYNIGKSTDFIEDRVRTIISILDLNKNSDEFLLDLSQGERKLVNIGVILAEDPAIILLDEPFESLDKWHINKLMKVFKRLTSRSKTILLSISVPDSEILMKCDKIFILANQSFIFEGSFPEYDKFYGEKTNPDEFVINLINIDYSEKIKESRDIQFIRENKERWYRNRVSRLDTTSYKQILSKESDKNKYKKISLLMKRHYQVFWRSKETFKIIFVQKAIFFFVSCIVYPFVGYSQEDIQTRIGLLGFLILNSIDRSMSIVLGSFNQSKLTTKREIVVGMYSSTEAYIAEYVFDFTLIYISTVFYIIPVYWITQINNSLYRFILFLISHFCLVNFTVGYSIFIGIITASPRSAHMFGSIGLLCFTAFSGIFVNVNTIPHFSRWLTWLSPMYYALEFNLQISLSNLVFICDSESCFRYGSEVLDDIGMNRLGKFLSLMIFIFYIIFFIGLGLISMALYFKPRMINEKVDIFKYFLLN